MEPNKHYFYLHGNIRYRLIHAENSRLNAPFDAGFLSKRAICQITGIEIFVRHRYKLFFNNQLLLRRKAHGFFSSLTLLRNHTTKNPLTTLPIFCVVFQWNRSKNGSFASLLPASPRFSEQWWYIQVIQTIFWGMEYVQHRLKLNSAWTNWLDWPGWLMANGLELNKRRPDSELTTQTESEIMDNYCYSQFCKNAINLLSFNNNSGANCVVAGQNSPFWAGGRKYLFTKLFGLSPEARSVRLGLMSRRVKTRLQQFHIPTATSNKDCSNNNAANFQHILSRPVEKVRC